MKKSAGILLFRRKGALIEFFLVHPGGPFWKNKDLGAWSIPKGEFEDDEDPMTAAKREFKEETGISINGKFTPLTPVKIKSGKLVYAFALEKDVDETIVVSNDFSMEWPPRSGTQQKFPEVDKAGWFEVDLAKEKINSSQAAFIDELLKLLTGKPGTGKS